ncbi:DNA-(apurinic or apyrimidinic site) endonuclease 2 isoform X2 [Procambarus clarkii]|uniref:DNA-(apurinic or apyrimidinic site) endonuclease 2 isoform X2 n=1 Tax=Procambarus clarkii TaxID=6728 RepID=UPI001E676A62|nr:DNA-(apurinic or apyrimidinic site) endonuclease 2-like isoform X1 [Procambarus clarkii]
MLPGDQSYTSGYSGVATFCSQSATPFASQEGLSGIYDGELRDGSGTVEALPAEWEREELKDLDSEGRAVITQHLIKDKNGSEVELAVINVYCPRVDPEKPERRAFKLRFYELLRQRAAVIRSTGCHVVIVGDINTSHKQIDHCDPDKAEIFEKRLDRLYLSNFLVPLCRKDIENAGRNLYEDCKVNKTCNNTVYKNKLNAYDQVTGSGSSLSLPENKLRNISNVEQELASQNVSEQICIHINTKMSLDKEYIKEGKDRCTKQKGKPVIRDEFEDDELSENHLLVSNTDFQVVDTYRYFYPDKKDAFTCWNTLTNSRSTNYGTRIDYVFCNEEFLPFVKDSLILQDIMGSDHCPVAILVIGKLIPSDRLPCNCAKFFPEFRGQQQKLLSYFQSQVPLLDGQMRRSQNCQNLPKPSKEGVLNLENSHCSVKRKNYNTKTKSSNKKNCIEKQRKLSSFFTSKVRDQGTPIVSPDIEDTEFGSQSSSQKLNDAKSTHTLLSNSRQIENDESASLDCKDVFSDDLASSAESIRSCPGTNLKSSQSKTENLGWNFLMKGPKLPPLCPGHNEPAVRLTVKKKGPNINRQFYACAKGVGKEGDPNARCNFFKWVGK